ncbi:hypothetical protein LTR84_003404 [Exophiala bonariae]|uniref:Receptor L-domain domain-containing protein n=1 Tax=Exophiala bonariae TaxID=1690606 RepID=A0AAV9N7R0_9EURO|nr:hypothetical protein LTR84_003404 [Exophiala bonariae]
MWTTANLVLAVAGLVSAQCTGSTTISSSSQATALAQCQSYDGDIRLGSDITGSISLEGVVTITGDLALAYGTEITSLTAPDLVTIGETLSISNNDLLTSISLPSLKNIDRIYISGAPNLTDIVSTNGISNISTIQISETALTKLDWLKAVNISRLELTENPGLSDVSLPVVNGLGSFTFEWNGPAMKISLPNLEAAYNLTFSHAQEIDLSALELVTYSLGFIANDLESLSMEKLSSLDNFMLWNNTALSQLSLPILTNVTGDIVTNGNTALGTLSLPSLERVRGDIALNGSYTNISMPALVDVQGNVVIRSSTAFNCSSLTPYDQSDVFKAQYNCTASELAATPSPAPDPGSESGGGGGLSTGAKAGIAVGVVLGVLAVGFAVWFLLKKRKVSNGSIQAPGTQADETKTGTFIDNKSTQGPYEADSQAVGRAELPTGHNDHTSTAYDGKPTSHGRAELFSEHPELHGNQRGPT